MLHFLTRYVPERSGSTAVLLTLEMGMWENGSTYGVPSFEDHPLEIDPGSVGGNQIVFA